MDTMFRQRRISIPKRTSELIALLALSSTLFLFLHTRDLNTKLRRMEQLNSGEEATNHITNRGQTDRTLSTNHDYRTYTDTVRKAGNPERFGPKRVLENQSEEEETGAGGLQTVGSAPEEYPEPWQLNNTARAGIDILFFNRVPKVGSQTFMEILRRLSARNNFGFNRDAVQRVETIRLSPQDQHILTALVSAYTPPSSYIKHVCHTNFTRYGYPTPIYMNVVRDPVERVISWFYYVRAPWYYMDRKNAFPNLPMPDPAWLKKDFETCVLSGDRECRYIQGESREGIGDHRRQTLFFCGHEPECTPFNSDAALERAKRVVESQYAVVGVLEDMNTTLTVLEHYIPGFFKGASKLYWDEMRAFRRINRNTFKPPVSEEVKRIVRANFTREIEFYEFCKKRLQMQLKALKLPASGN